MGFLGMVDCYTCILQLERSRSGSTSEVEC